ncbi:hypothetical protein VTN02DRAFT_486 [Thermoascus thermophilus]
MLLSAHVTPRCFSVFAVCLGGFDARYYDAKCFHVVLCWAAFFSCLFCLMIVGYLSYRGCVVSPMGGRRGGLSLLLLFVALVLDRDGNLQTDTDTRLCILFVSSFCSSFFFILDVIYETRTGRVGRRCQGRHGGTRETVRRGLAGARSVLMSGHLVYIWIFFFLFLFFYFFIFYFFFPLSGPGP